VSQDDVAKVILEFVQRQVPVPSGEIGLDTPLTDGTLDSLALINLLAFLKSKYRIEIKHADVTPSNFGSTAAVGRFVESRMRAVSASHAPER
jgi:acyl carrier protein